MTDLQELLARRRMCRSFAGTPLGDEVVDRVLGAALRAPSAGNTDGLDLVVLRNHETNRYWDVTLPASRRDGFAWPGLLRAPLLVLPISDPAAYLRRYGEPDKARTGLGAGASSWAVPYWTVDASFAAMLIQLAAIDEGLGVLFFGLFEHTEPVKEALGIPSDRQPIGALAIGIPDGEDVPGRSADRPSRPRGDRPPRRVVTAATHTTW